MLPLHIAEMDVRLAPAVAAALRAATGASDTGYVGAIDAYVDAFAGFAKRRWDWDVERRHVRLCADVAVGIIETLRRLLDRGDRVVITSPVYPPFRGWLRDVGALFVDIPLLDVPNGGRLDLDRIAAAFADGARAIILCNPHNPTGRVHDRSELCTLAGIADRYGAIVLSDEIHAPLVHEAHTFTPYLTASDTAAANGIAFSSASKGWNLAGLKCALIVAGSARAAHLFERSRVGQPWSVGIFGMLAGEAAFAQAEPWLDDLIVALRANAALLRSELAEHVPAVRLVMPASSFLVWLDFSELRLGEAPAPWLLEHARIALADGEDFGAPGIGHARFNIACSPAIIREAVGRLAAAAR